ncbi:ATP-dependent DNA ligase LigA [Haloprofundus halophilus]|uniref:ATP-dependent DNA ligase LigA n=1 Tax=Haloprofundus halophilus TaxID=2283527 RepID=UPI000E44F860|nr:ATP-dependent DNA ligase LigA [Haloprofundus halophilus]
MEFAAFADRAAAIEAESADLEIVSLLAETFLEAGPELPVVARFVQGRVFPAWRSATLDIGPSLCYEAIARAAGRNVDASDVESKLAETGEIGAVAASYEFGGQRGLAAFGTGGAADLTVAEVDETLRALAAATGSGSQDRKVDTLFGLFNRTSPEEARYLARIVLSEMRIGVGEGAVRDAISEAFEVPTESVERALQVSNDYGHVAEIARDDGVDGLNEVGLEVGRPVQAMLAQAGTVTDALDEWEDAVVETKYDGARVQIHRRADDAGDDGDSDGDNDTGDENDAGNENDAESAAVSLFSRNMEDVTDALPEIVEFVERAVDAPAILDGEVVAVDDEGDPLPFQEVLRRFRRKHDVARMREEVTLRLHAFDCLHADGDDLLEEPLVTRHDRLADVVDDDAAVSTLLRSADADEIAAFEADALDAGHEGIMLKDPESTYSPGNRGRHWLKRKPDVETLDLVVTGAEWGEGRRAQFLGTFLLSARDENGRYRTLGKVATGITDEQLAELTERLEPEIVSQDGREVELRPSTVFEVGYEEIQRSPTYSSGYALRFPRFLSVREDKSPEDADALARVERLAETQ